MLVDPTEDQLNAAKASAEQVYAATHQAQEIDAVAGEPASTTTGLTISESAIGTDTHAQSPLIITINANAKAGDIYKVTIPADNQLYTFDSVDSLGAEAGTTTTTLGTDGSHIITDTFATDTASTQRIKLNLTSPFLAPARMADVGKTVTKNVTFTVNGKPQTGVSFTQTVKPTTKLSTITMLHPDPSTVEQLLPNQNYIFGVSVNESDGIPYDDSFGTTNRASKVDNYGGTKIIIPVPTGFNLDSDSTAKMNAFTDGTTITQPGGKGTDVIINAPAGAGGQVGNNGILNSPEYQIVGAFDVSQTTTAQALTASGDVTFSQIINGDSTNNTITDSADPWKVTILPNNGGTNVGQSDVSPIAKGNSTGNSSQLVLDNIPSDDPENLNSFGFEFNSAANATDTQITINVPDGLDATSIQTPAQGITPSAYLPDTSSYKYTLTLANGETETGTVAAGTKVTSADGSAIRTAVFEPNAIAAGSFAEASDDASGFSVKGHLATNYDDNTTAVKYNDKLTSSINISFKAGDEHYERKASVNQTAVEALAIGDAYLVTRTNHQTPGNSSAGTLQIRYDDFGQGQNTNSVDEPTFYFVLPKATTVASVNSLGSMNDDPIHDSRYTPDPTGAQLTQVTGAKVSEFTADNGQTVVKIDYSGTGKIVDFSQVTGYWGAVTLANNPDALPGDYPYYVYISSSKTKLVNSTKPIDSSFVQNDPNAYLMRGEAGTGTWNISTASSFFNTSFAQGNTDATPVNPESGKNSVGTSDDKKTADMTFYDTIVYTSPATDAQDHNATAVINLPTVGDSKGSQYTFDLKGPITMPTNFTTANGDGTALNSTVLYSTTAQTFNTADTSPSTTGYVTADQIPNGDWSKIRSIMIQVSGIKPNTSTGRIAIAGKVADQTVDGKTITFNDMAGNTGYLQTAFYGDGSKVVVSSTDALIKIVGTSTVKARYHYVDAEGHDQYVEIPDLTQTVNDNVDTLKDYPKTKSEFNATDTALIPKGYQLETGTDNTVTRTIIDSGKKDGLAALGQVAHYYDDGDYVQYDLIGDSSLTVTYVDNDNKNQPVGNPVEVDGVTNQKGTYDVKVPDNYELAKGQADKLTYTITPDDTDNLTVNLVHKHTTNLPDGFTGTTTRTITYTGLPEGNPNPVSQPLNWTADTDEVTHVTTYTPIGNYPQVISPSIPGYTPNEASVAAGIDQATTTQPVDSSITVTYSANNADLTVTYVDTDANNKVVGTPETLTGKTNETGNYQVVIPDHYVLAAGQDDQVPYTFKAGNDTSDNLTIKLAHKLDRTTTISTRTIHYAVDDPSYTGTVPAPKVETITWHVVTDEVTSDSVATPDSAYDEVPSPTIPGYTVNPSQVGQQTVAKVATRDVPMYNEDVVVTYTPIAKPDGGGTPGTPTNIQKVPTPPENVPTDNTTTPGKVITKTPEPGEAVTKTNQNQSNGGSGTSVETGENAGRAETLSETTAGASSHSANANSTTTVLDNQVNPSTTNQQQLPQTNEQNQAMVGFGLLGMLTSLLGAAGLKRRKRNDE